MSICPTTGKTQYDSEKAASVGLERMKKYKPDYDGEPYFCMYCSNYHFGKKQEKPVKKKRKRTQFPSGTVVGCPSDPQNKEIE